MTKKEVLNASINHVLKLVGERESTDIVFPVREKDILRKLSYRNLECLVVSLYHQLRYLEEKHQTTFYTINLDYLFEVKRDGITKAFVYGVCAPDDDNIENTMCEFKRETGIATRYVPLMDETAWKEFVDPSLILYAGLPIRFHYKTIYYSIAMVVEKLFGRDLSLLSGTKLEGFIKRAKNPQVSKRILLF